MGSLLVGLSLGRAIAFARANDQRFDQLPSVIPQHMHPRDLLSDGRSVCVFFLPFDESIVFANADGDLASQVWARAYVETNELLARMAQGKQMKAVQVSLGEEGFVCNIQ